MTDSNKYASHDKKPLDFKIDIDPKLGESLQGGLDSLQKVFARFVQTIKDAVGPEMLKNLEVGNWLEQLALCLDQIATGLREQAAVPADKSGELSFYREQFDEAVRGSKFESQQAALRQRLESAAQCLEQVDRDNAGKIAKTLSEVAGYFHAAAKSAVPIQFGATP